MKFVTAVRLFAIVSCIFLAGCASFLNHDVNIDSIGNDSVIVMGVAPEVRLAITRGKNQSDGWHADKFQAFLHVAESSSGYVVVKFPGRSNGRNYGVTNIKTDGILSNGYSPCGDEETIIFDAPAGSVVFVGDFVFSPNESDQPKSRGIDKAREFLSANYPALAPHLTSGIGELENVANIRCPRWYDYIQIPIIL